MKSMIGTAAKKVTLALLYDLIDERTKDLRREINDLRSEMNRRFEHMETQIGAVNSRVDGIYGLYVEILKAINNSRK